MKNPVENTLYKIGLALLGVSPGFLYLYHYFHFDALPCVLRRATGIYCPGCGGTRAVNAFLHGHWVQAFCYHPFVPYASLLFLWFMISHTIEYLSQGKIPLGMRYRNLYLYLGLVIILLHWVLIN